MANKTISELLLLPKGLKPWYTDGYLSIVQHLQTHQGSISALQGSPQIAGDIAGAIDTRWSAVTGGTGNAFTLSGSATISSRSDNMFLLVEFNRSNSGASTIDDGLGAVALRRPDGTALQSGDTYAGLRRFVVWDAGAGYYRFTGQMAQAADPPVIPIIDVTANLNVDATHQGRLLLVDAGTGSRDIQLPLISAVGNDFPVVIRAADVTNTITIKRNVTASPVDTIDGQAKDLILATADEQVTLVSNGTDWLILEDNRAPLVVNATLTSGQSCPGSNAWTTLVWNNELLDPRAWLDTGTGKILIDKAGVYGFATKVAFTGFPINVQQRAKITDTNVSPNTVFYAQYGSSAGNTADNFSDIALMRYFAAGTQIEIQVINQDSVARTIHTSSELQMLRLAS